MEQNTADTVASDIREQPFVIGVEVEQYLTNNPSSPNTQLFSMLVLLRAYVPRSYLLMAECQQVLGPSGPTDGGPSFEERMKPFTGFITTSNSPTPGDVHVSMIYQIHAQTAQRLLTKLEIAKSATVKNLLLLCGKEPQPYLTQIIKDLLTKREMGTRGKTEFSRLIEDILTEDVDEAFSVLETASEQFNNHPSFPQIISRLSCTKRGRYDFAKAEEWAMTAIKRALVKSDVADTLGQVYKKWLRRQHRGSSEVLEITEKALKAFKDLEEKAEGEEVPDMEDTAHTVRNPNYFSNRGHFGFIQVANLAFDKLPEEERRQFIQNKTEEVGKKFDFFEWYLTYSEPKKTASEPHFFWRDIVRCYENYTQHTEPESHLYRSFPGLLRLLNHGLFIFKETCAEFEDSVESVAYLSKIQGHLKRIHEENVDDVKAAERYILSNIILSNRRPLSPQLTPVRDLQAIIHGFLGSDEKHRSPEFYLLVLLLLWPDKEVDQQATENTISEDKPSEDDDSEEQPDTRGEPAQQQPPTHGLQKYVTLMEEAWKNWKTGYAKYLRGRYLVPLFFLGKGSGLKKWIHKSRLDVIVERKVDAELVKRRDTRHEMKMKLINDMWISGDVWQVPEIQDILLPVQNTKPHEKKFVCTGGLKIEASREDELDDPVGPQLFYLGFNIRGPVLFPVILSQ